MSPAEYASWLARGPWQDERFPDGWPGRPDLPLRSDARVVAVAHVYYPELLDELIGHLASIPVPFDLIVTHVSGLELDLDGAPMPHLQRAVVLGVENRGRDLWPLVQLVNAGLLDRYDLVVKVHTKRSHWRDAHRHLSGTGGTWRTSLLAALLGDTANVANILGAFEMAPDIGMATADGSVLGPEFWGQDRAVTETLLRRVGIELRPDELSFAAGSMYWTRARILQSLRALRLSRADFEDERGQVDGTTAHALERVIGLLALEAGLRIVERSRLPGTGG